MAGAEAGVWTTAPTVRDKKSQCRTLKRIITKLSYYIKNNLKCRFQALMWLMSQRLLCFPGVQCPFPGSVAHGRVTPTLNEYLYRDYIFVRCDTGYKLMMVRWKSPLCRQIWHISVNPVFLLGWGRAAELLCHVPKQQAVAPPSA